MIPDATIRQNIIEELDFEPIIDATHIAVTVSEGIVTLSGQVMEYRQKLMAEASVFRVSGVAGIVQDLDIMTVDNDGIDDKLLRTCVLDQLRWNAQIPAETIKVDVRDGWVMLQGKVKWQFQREAVDNIVNNLCGLRGMLNQISLAPAACADTVKQEIEQALSRNACARNTPVAIKVERNTVTLEGGPVQSWLIRSAIRQVAWSAPGVTEVIDHLQQPS